MDDWQPRESELAPETQVAVQVASRLPLLLARAPSRSIACLCWRRTHARAER